MKDEVGRMKNSAIHLSHFIFHPFFLAGRQGFEPWVQG
jgi:hypothetical protein